jgi:hypothetical protein
MAAKTLLILPCAILALNAAASAPTFNHDIAPILYKNCTLCHREGEAAPFALVTYADAKKKSATLAKAVHNRVMPPWKAEPVDYAYRNDRRLTDSEIALIDEWAKAGAPEGNASERPIPPTFASGWRLGPPDLILEFPTAYNIPADGPDIYRNIAMPIPITEDRWLTAIDMHPSARAVVHHVLYFGDPNAKAHEKKQGDQPGFGGMRPGGSLGLGGWAVGGQPSFFPENLAIKIPAASDLVVQYHFHPTGKPEAEKSQIAFYFAKEPPKRSMVRIQMPPHYSLFSGLDIPAGEKDYVIKDSYTLPVAIQAVGVSTHAHYIAKKIKLTATFPDGPAKTLFLVNDWDFAWQDRYYFKDFPKLPAGTRLDAEIHWDNSAENPHNPSSPPVRVEWGEATKDEMGSISLIAVADQETDLPKLHWDIGKREEKLVRSKMQSDPQFAAKVMQLLSE